MCLLPLSHHTRLMSYVVVHKDLFLSYTLYCISPFSLSIFPHFPVFLSFLCLLFPLSVSYLRFIFLLLSLCALSPKLSPPETVMVLHDDEGENDDDDDKKETR